MKRVWKNISMFIVGAGLMALLFGCSGYESYGPLQRVPSTKVVELHQNNCRFLVTGDKASIVLYSLNSIEWVQAFSVVKSMGVKHLDILVRSSGGALIDMAHIIETLEQFKLDGGTVTTHASGFIASAAVPIYLTGDYRTMGKNTLMMLHPHSEWNQLNTNYQYQLAFPEGSPGREGYIKANHFWNVIYCAVLVQRTTMTCDECFAIMEPDQWNSVSGMYFFTAEEALTMGFVHKIL